jgi:ubiquilin
MSTDLFHDGGVIKTVIRPSAETTQPKQGDEVALAYHFMSESDTHTKNLVYIVGTSQPDMFLPVRTLDRIVCDMKRNEKARFRIAPQYSGMDALVEIEITIFHFRSNPSASGSAGIGSLTGQLGDFQSHLNRNPDVMEQMMTSPFMQSLLSNPDTLRSIIGSNPQMQELMRQNPELNSMMNDPQFLQQTAEAMRNPAMMREMMRNTDRAMSNIESLPGGSAALHKLYNEVQAPLYEASQGGSGPVKKISDINELKAKYGDLAKPQRPVSEPMANPWSKAPPKMPAPTVPQTRSGPMDMSAMAQMMQDPALQQLLGSSLSSTAAQNRQSNPGLLNNMFNPTTLQSIGRLEQSLSPPGNGSFNSLFGNFLYAAQTDPQTKFKTQLETLREMGFTDTTAAIRALEETGGDVDEAAVKLALEMEQSASSPKK